MENPQINIDKIGNNQYDFIEKVIISIIVFEVGNGSRRTRKST